MLTPLSTLVSGRRRRAVLANEFDYPPVPERICLYPFHPGLTSSHLFLVLFGADSFMRIMTAAGAPSSDRLLYTVRNILVSTEDTCHACTLPDYLLPIGKNKQKSALADIGIASLPVDHHDLDTPSFILPRHWTQVDQRT